MKDLTGKGKPFHSALDKAAALLKRKVGTGAEFMKELQGLGGIKQAEIEERKLGDLLGLPKMTHEEFLSHLAAKPVPAIKEKVFRSPTEKEIEEKARELAYKKIMDDWAYGEDNNLSHKEAEADAKDYAEGHGGSREYLEAAADELALANQKPHHEKWTIPGGENYREMLIKAPKGGEEFGGVGAHFRGEPGILASMRVKDRTGPNGEKLLHLEELQSDWHQQGRERGYKGDFEPESEMIKKRDDLYDARTALVKQALAIEKTGELAPQELIDQIHGMNDQLRTIEERKDKARNATPNAPFKKNWEEMALKRLIHHAAEKGYHGIVVTPGKEQADRYSLAKHVGMVAYHPEEQRFQAFKPNRETVMNERGVTPERISELIGKEAAEKLLKAPKVGDHHFLEGEQLQIGGEGMKGFYDKKVPNILNAIGKKHGVKTQLHGHTLKGRGRERTDEEHRQAIQNAGLDYWNMTPEQRSEHDYEPKPVQLHHFPITEPMRKDILTNGLPLYAEGGVIHKAEGGNVQIPVDQMRQALMQNKYPGFSDLSKIGAKEAPDLPIKGYVSPAAGQDGQLPVGGVDMSMITPGMQYMPEETQAMKPQQPGQPGQPGQPPQGAGPLSSGPSSPLQQPPSNILQMTPQGQALNAMTPPQPQRMAGGGNVELPMVYKAGGSDNMPMDTQSMDNGATTFDMNNMQNYAYGGDVQGYASKGYVVHEPKNPHPDVGNRYKAVQLPGLMPEHPVDLEQLYNDKASIQLRPWDATNRHVNVTNISGHDLLQPLTTEGGQPFARDIKLGKKGIVSASNEGIQRKIQGRANTAHEENIKQGGHGHTYDIISTMDAPAPFFTHMPLHIQLDLLKQRQLKPEQLKDLADKVRAIKVRDQKTKKITNPYANMLPLDHPELWDQMMKGGHGIGAPGKMRTALSATLGQVGQQKLLDYNLPDLMNAITDAEIRKAPATYAGNTFLANVPYADLGPQHHTIYDKSGYGEYGGKGPQMPAELYMTDVYDQILAEMKQKHPNAGASALRALTIGALQTRAGGVSQMVNDRVLRNAERFTKDTKSGEISDPHDLWNVIGHFYKKYGGYKNGGKVDKEKLSDNLDTMRLALTKKKAK
jgi:hypothetical protein